VLGDGGGFKAGLSMDMDVDMDGEGHSASEDLQEHVLDEEEGLENVDDADVRMPLFISLPDTNILAVILPGFRP